jgi:hypothetical protein
VQKGTADLDADMAEGLKWVANARQIAMNTDSYGAQPIQSEKWIQSCGTWVLKGGKRLVSCR